jgi:Protein of unknown function (DUF1488)
MPSSIKFGYYFYWSARTQTVRFYARHGEARIWCAVTRTALEERAGLNGPPFLQPPPEGSEIVVCLLIDPSRSGAGLRKGPLWCIPPDQARPHHAAIRRA